MWHYLLYAFYRYDIERDAGETQAARAVLDGVYDAYRGVFGPYPHHRRVGVMFVRGLFQTARTVARLKR